MFTTNLHNTLREYNEARPIKKDEELLLQEVQNIINQNDQKDLNVLYRLGMAENLNKAKLIESVNEQTKPFDEVYDISVIKCLAINYRLRFLKSNSYKGNIDPYLPTAVNQFSEKYKLSDYHSEFYILAPAKSFKLEKRPVDPIIFYKINDEKYAFVHKWGNDFSFLRNILNFPLRTRWHITAFVYAIFASLFYKYVPIQHDWFFIFIMVIAAAAVTLITVTCPMYNTSNEVWNSKYKD